MNDTQASLPDHSNYMNDSQSQKHIILLNDTYTHIPNKYLLDDLPQNLTILNETYITYNYYKL